MDDERRGFLTGNLAYVLWGLLTLYWHELTGLDAFGLIAWRIVWSVVVLAVLLTFAEALDRRCAACSRRRRDRADHGRRDRARDELDDVRVVRDARPRRRGRARLLPRADRSRPRRRRDVPRTSSGARRSSRSCSCGLAVVVLAVGYGSPPWFALLIAVSWTVYGVSKKRAALPPLEGLAAETLVLAPIAVVLLVVMQAGGNPSLGGASTLQLVLVPFTGLVTTVPLLLFAYAARRVPLAMLGWTAVLGADDQPGARRRGLRRVDARHARIAGFALVWIALALITIDGIRASRAAPDDAAGRDRARPPRGLTCTSSLTGKYLLAYSEAVPTTGDDDMAQVFKALADPTRRRLLDRLHEDNGQTLSALGQELGMTRQGVTAHLDVLVAAHLVTTVKHGREKLHYLNPVPLQEIHERWIAKFELPDLEALSGLKQHLEKESTMEKSTYVYATFIASTPERIWEALTDPDQTQAYWGHRNVSDWTKGSPWTMQWRDGDGANSGGEIIEVDPPRRARAHLGRSRRRPQVACDLRHRTGQGRGQAHRHPRQPHRGRSRRHQPGLADRLRQPQVLPRDRHPTQRARRP